MGIGYLFKTEQIGILASTFSASIFLFLSGILMPIENMPGFLMKIVQFNPFVLSVSLLRKSILFQQSFMALQSEMLYLVLFIAVMALSYLLFHLLGNGKRYRAST